MLSVLIPVYNIEVDELLRRLTESCQSAKIDFEIILRDDCSETIYWERLNDSAAVFDHVLLRRNSINQGRSKTRNMLVEDAKYDRVLFIDADCIPVHANFIGEYLRAKGPVISGGHNYSDKLADQRFLLHWNYGKKREVRQLKEKLNQPYRYFFTSNILVDKRLFERIPFDEEIKSYGYEDNRWASSLYENGIEITHIDNPVMHLGLKTNQKFIADLDDSINALAELMKRNIQPDIRLYQAYKKTSKSALGRFVLNCLANQRSLLKKQMERAFLPMFFMDLYKLGQLHSKFNM